MKYEWKIADLFDLSHTVAGDFLRKCLYPWEVLEHIGAWILAVGGDLSAEFYDHPAEGIWIAKNARVAPTASITGPCIIGENAEVRHCAFIRGKALIGCGAVVGNSTELKNVILFDEVQVPHFNYVGDSILGYKAHLGAGAVTSNVKSDKSPVVIRCGEQKIETGRKKVGAFIGDRAEVGCGSVLNPGCVLGQGSTVYPLSSVRGVIAPGVIYKSRNEIVPRR
ncbi:MAG: UDP-N-acetylglucosamine pyrophosphorylase [Clostridia bacterium]|nr:UDP-N-acetylglucosamine pyrophosphorylase [Clostridia bacterium]